MRKELDDVLCATFPRLYRDRRGDPKETLLCFGFPADGWFLILWNLSDKLETLIRELPEEDRDKYRAVQVKEKFGTLRYYMTAGTPEMDVAVRAAETLSASTCEWCGRPAKVGETGGWMITLCEEHRAERKAGKRR